MVEKWNPGTLRVRRYLVPAWVNLLEAMYTNRDNNFSTVEILEELGRAMPQVPRQQAINLLSNARKYLERNGVLTSKKIKFRVKSGGSFQMMYTMTNRERILRVIQILKANKIEQLPIDVTSPDSVVTVDMDKDAIIMELVNQNRELRKEIAEILEERSERLAVIHEASLKVEEATRKIASAKQLPASVVAYLKELGILPEKKDEDEKA